MKTIDPRKQGEEARAERRRDALRRLLKWRGWSVAECAKNAGLVHGSGRPTSAIDNFLNGRSRSLSAEALEAIADAFGITVDVVLGRAPILELPADHGSSLGFLDKGDRKGESKMLRKKTRIQIRIEDKVTVDSKIDNTELDRLTKLIQMLLSACIGK